MIRVLLVDDEVLALDYLKNMIDWEAQGFTVVGTCTSGRSALALLERENPQIVISDIKMPGMDGVELAERIQRLKRIYICIPFIKK